MPLDTCQELSKEIKDFSSLFDLTPSIAILDYNLEFDKITKSLNNFVIPYDGEVTTIQTTNSNELRVKLKKSNYDYGVISNILLDQQDKQNFMKFITLSIRDSGYIIILEDKNKDVSVIYELLEEFDYGAISSIDIFDGYHLIMGKKLHMWGMD